MTVAQAAEALGISPEAVRMRIKRGTLRSEREGGHVYVVLGTEQTRPASDRPTELTPDRTDDLIEAMQERIDDLRAQLDQANEANRENRRIIAALTSRIPELEAPQDERESPTKPAEPVSNTKPPSETETPEERLSWWRRWFGG